MEVIIDTPTYAYYNNGDARLVELCRGDIVSMNNCGAVATFGRKLCKLNVGVSYRIKGLTLLCTAKTRRKWWKFWLPRYIYAQFMVVGIEQI